MSRIRNPKSNINDALQKKSNSLNPPPVTDSDSDFERKPARHFKKKKKKKKKKKGMKQKKEKKGGRKEGQATKIQLQREENQRAKTLKLQAAAKILLRQATTSSNIPTFFPINICYNIGDYWTIKKQLNKNQWI